MTTTTATDYRTLYATLHDAESDGWIRAGRARRINDRLHICDTSGGNSYGYAFSLVAADGDDRTVLLDARTVHLTEELNRTGRPGSFSLMFRRDEFQRHI